MKIADWDSISFTPDDLRPESNSCRRCINNVPLTDKKERNFAFWQPDTSIRLLLLATKKRS